MKPSRTRTAPNEPAWSCIGVGWPGRQQSTSSSAWSQRKTRWRAYVASLNETYGRNSSRETSTRSIHSSTCASVGRALKLSIVSTSDASENVPSRRKPSARVRVCVVVCASSVDIESRPLGELEGDLKNASAPDAESSLKGEQ